MYLATICGVFFLLLGSSTQALKAAFVSQESQPSQTEPSPQTQDTPQTNSPSEPKPEDQQTKPEQPANAEPPANQNNSQTQPAESKTPEATPVKPAAKKPASKTPSKKRRAKQQPAPPPDKSKVVIKNGSTTDPKIQLSSGGQQQANQQIQSANSLLDATNANLKKIAAKKLDATQEDMVKQIKDYMDQSKSAAAAGDPHGAQTLATKAHLLSEELVKP